MALLFKEYRIANIDLHIALQGFSQKLVTGGLPPP